MTDERLRAHHERAGHLLEGVHILTREVSQPFKQAFRVIYLLTPAERATERYSNRFVAHVLTGPGWTATTCGRRTPAHLPDRRRQRQRPDVVVVLSKAFMLAADDRITDPTILWQLQ